MTTRWCPRCGAQYRAGVEHCADCAVALVDEEPEVGVVVYELGDWTAEERGALELRLDAEGIEHQWETAEGSDVKPGYAPGQPWEVGTDLVVGEHDEARVDELLDELESPDALEAAPDDGSDEVTYAVMGRLYVAADRLKSDPDDLGLAGEFFDAADAARAIEPPFGIDPDVWRRVQDLAAQVTEALEEESDDDVVRSAAQRLRDVLFGYV